MSDLNWVLIWVDHRQCYLHNATMDMERKRSDDDEEEQGGDENARTEERDEATGPCIALEFDGLHCFETIVSH